MYATDKIKLIKRVLNTDNPAELQNMTITKIIGEYHNEHDTMDDILVDACVTNLFNMVVVAEAEEGIKS